jgi:hypothetical protein
MAPSKRKNPHTEDAPPAKSTRSSLRPNSTSTPTSITTRAASLSKAASTQARKKAQRAVYNAQRQQARARDKVQRDEEQQQARAREGEETAAKEKPKAKAKAKIRPPHVSWQSPLERPSSQAAPTPATTVPRAPTLSPITPDIALDAVAPVPSSPPILIHSSPSPDRARPPATIQQTAEPVVPSSPVQSLDYKVGIQYALFVNGSRKARHTELDKMKSSISMSDIEDVVESMIQSPLSSVNGRTYAYVGRSMSFKTDWHKATWCHLSPVDFSETEGEKMWNLMDFQVRRGGPRKRVDVRVEAKINVDSLSKAFVRTALDPSSDPPIATPMSKTRTNQLLRENEAIEKAERLRSKIDHVSSITKYWTCNIPQCGNYQGLCYVHPPTHQHFEIRVNEVESFANMILKGEDGAAVSYPPIKLIELWQTRPNKLIVNPHNGRAIGSGRKKKGRSLSSSSDSNDTAVMLKLMRQQQKMTMQNTILQMQERAVEQQHLQQSRYPHTNEVYSISQPFQSSQRHQPSISAHTTTTTRTGYYPTASSSSSPISGDGKADTRSTARMFMRWLVNEQPEEDRAEYQRAQEIVVEQMWTIGDLRDMSTIGTELYRVAISEPYRLKDGVVRHFREDLRRFKAAVRQSEMNM